MFLENRDKQTLIDLLLSNPDNQIIYNLEKKTVRLGSYNHYNPINLEPYRIYLRQLLKKNINIYLDADKENNLIPIKFQYLSELVAEDLSQAVVADKVSTTSSLASTSVPTHTSSDEASTGRLNNKTHFTAFEIENPSSNQPKPQTFPVLSGLYHYGLASQFIKAFLNLLIFTLNTLKTALVSAVTKISSHTLTPQRNTDLPYFSLFKNPAIDGAERHARLLGLEKLEIPVPCFSHSGH